MKPFVWSATNLRDADNCLRAFEHKHILKDIPFEETVATRWGSKVHTAMEARLRAGLPLPEGMETYEQFIPPKTGLRGLIEFKMGMKADGSACGFFDEGVWGRGKMDFGLINADAKTAAIVDWKTGKVREDPDELEIFAVLLKAKYPDLETITGWYVWLKETRMGKVHDLSDTNGKLANIKFRVEKIHHAMQMQAFEPRQSGLCGFCPVRTCEYRP